MNQNCMFSIKNRFQKNWPKGCIKGVAQVEYEKKKPKKWKKSPL